MRQFGLRSTSPGQTNVAVKTEGVIPDTYRAPQFATPQHDTFTERQQYLKKKHFELSDHGSWQIAQIWSLR